MLTSAVAGWAGRGLQNVSVVRASWRSVCRAGLEQVLIRTAGCLEEILLRAKGEG